MLWKIKKKRKLRYCDKCGEHYGNLSRLARKIHVKTGERLCSICANRVWRWNK